MIDGVRIVPRSRIPDERGTVMHMLKVTDPEFEQFGEIYFSTVYPGIVKGWHRHLEMTLNYVCVAGRIKLVLFDDREGSPTRGEIMERFLGPDDYSLVQVPPGVWNGFKGMGHDAAIVANCATHPHDPTSLDPPRSLRQRHPVRLGRSGALMRVLVTGAAGFIGAHVVRGLLAEGHETYALVRPGSDAARLDAVADRITVVSCDLGDSDRTMGLVAEIAPDAIVHLAWYVEPGAYRRAVAENVESVRASATLLRGGRGRRMSAGRPGWDLPRGRRQLRAGDLRVREGGCPSAGGRLHGRRDERGVRPRVPPLRPIGGCASRGPVRHPRPGLRRSHRDDRRDAATRLPARERRRDGIRDVGRSVDRGRDRHLLRDHRHARGCLRHHRRGDRAARPARRGRTRRFG